MNNGHFFGEILKRVPNMSKINVDDAELIKSEFGKYPPKYANSWLYLLRATRDDFGNSGYKLVRDNNYLFLGFRNNTCYIVNPNGSNISGILLELCHLIDNLFGCPIVIRKVSENVAERLLQTQIFWDISQNPSSGLLEDDTFPENYLKLGKILSPNLSLEASTKKIKKKIRKFEQASVALDVQDGIEKGIKNEATNALENLTRSSKGKYHSYLPMLLAIFHPVANRNTYRLRIYKHKQDYHGLYISEQLGNSTIGLYCAISSKALGGITEWMDIDFLSSVFKEGVEYVLLGGSETAGVHHYVEKLRVDAVPYLTFSLLYFPKRS